MEQGRVVDICPKDRFNKNYSNELIDLCYKMLEYYSNKRISSIDALFSSNFENDIKATLLKSFPNNDINFLNHVYQRFGSKKASDFIMEIQHNINSKDQNDPSKYNQGSNDFVNSDYVKGMIAIDYLKIFYLEQDDNQVFDVKGFRKFDKIFEFAKVGKIDSTYLCLACEI